MARYMADLPAVEVPFPVYGLGAQFDGYRWLAMYNVDEQEQLYEVGLGHGRPTRKAGYVVVYTFRKTPWRPRTRPLRSPDLGHPPTGYTDAFFRGLDGLLGLNEIKEQALYRERASLMADLLSEAEWDDWRGGMNRPDRLDDAWTPTSVTIDGHPCSADARTYEGRWATLIDLPTVAVSITGPDSMLELTSPIVDVRGVLSTYV